MVKYNGLYIYIALAASVLLASSPVDLRAQTYKTEKGHAEFHSQVPLHKFSGSSDHLVGLIDLGDSTVDFYLDLTTLDTGNSKRDKDMRRTLDTDNHPFAEFFGKLATPFDPDSPEEQQVTVEGEFKIHGVTKKVSIDGTLKKAGDELHVRASWILNLDDYNIEPPGILFYKVDEEQEIEIEAVLMKTEKSK